MTLPLDRILQGDSLTVLDQLPAGSVDVVFADPPYNLQLQHTLHRPDQSRVDAVDDDWDKFPDLAAYDAFTRAWLSACRRVLKDSGTLWVIGSYHNIFRVGSILMDLGFWVLNDIIWHKSNPMPNFRGRRFTNATETLIWAKKSAAQTRYTFNYQAMKAFNDDKQMPNVWHLPICSGKERLKIDGKKAHPTQKPEALLYRVLTASTNAGDVVLDPFFGSGTTGAVAKRLGRHFIGIERDPDYVRVATARIDAITAAPHALLDTPPADTRTQPRVSFGALVAAGYLHAGQTLTDRHGQLRAQILPDGRVRAGETAASIHRMAAHLTGRPAYNGWEFWHIYTEAGTVGESIDAVRARYRADARATPPLPEA